MECLHPSETSMKLMAMCSDPLPSYTLWFMDALYGSNALQGAHALSRHTQTDIELKYERTTLE